MSCEQLSRSTDREVEREREPASRGALGSASETTTWVKPFVSVGGVLVLHLKIFRFDEKILKTTGAYSEPPCLQF